MRTLNEIPFTLNSAKLAEQLQIEPSSEDAEDFEELVREAQRIGSPKAIYKEAFVEGREGDTVRVGSVEFTSRTLARNLASVERVFAFVATCGREVHDASVTGGDFLKEFWWDAIKNRLLSAATTYLNEHLHSTYRLGKTASMSPGSGDTTVWPIEQQEQLFALIGDVRSEVGVELTDSYLMVPNKTLSGIRFQAEVDFRSCQVCHREKCPSRNAPFDEALWKEIHEE
jgi:hypothetical protein